MHGSCESCHVAARFDWLVGDGPGRAVVTIGAVVTMVAADALQTIGTRVLLVTEDRLGSDGGGEARLISLHLRLGDGRVHPAHDVVHRRRGRRLCYFHLAERLM